MTPGAATGGLPIEFSGLTKHFGPVLAVDHLSFTVEPGRVTGFVCPNGSGKTTSLRMLLGLVHPSEGTATIGGRRYQDLDHPTRTVGAVLEATSFHPERRARTHLRMAAAAGGHDEERVDEVLELVGLTADAERKVGGFSMGMRQRLELGCPTRRVRRWPAISPAASAERAASADAASAFHLLTWWEGGLAMVAWGIVPLVLGYFTTFDKDVT